MQQFYLTNLNTYHTFIWNGTEDENEDDAEEKSLGAIENTKIYLKNLSTAFKYILKSRRLRSLIIFNAIFASLIALLVNLRRSLLTDIGVTPIQFGFIFAILGIIAAITSAKINKIHKKLKNRALTHLGLYFTSSVILSGAVVLLNIPTSLMISLVLFSIIIQYSIKGPYATLIKQYLTNFSHPSMRIKIQSANILIECITSTLLTLFCSFLLSITSSAYTTLIIGLIIFIVLILTLDYMKTRVGLKPEEYKNSDINYHELL
ncbi:MAG: hypothetical protein IKF52_01610 [Clostridia bacterium]|nr:hypothetical protein [Clostridia bacterium]